MATPTPLSRALSPRPRTLALRDDVALTQIAPARWNELAAGQPLLSHAFLTALHDSGCAAPRTGWRPRYVTAWADDTLQGALPMYEKMHSYGEYVFDWAWADAYRRYQRRYYPKLVVAIPFTPTSGERLLAGDDATRAALLGHARGLLAGGAFSSLHVLFPTAAEAALCEAGGMLVRHGVQFHWDNPGYGDFADFLAAFSHDKRKKVKQERRKLAEAGVKFQRKVGGEISAADWAFFHACYEGTYHAHGSTPYLSLEFFERIGQSMPANLLLVLGTRDGRPICAALDVFDGSTLWGRYWGAPEYVPGMHFEACYYQAIEFCIERGIARFEGGAQGVHKLARGLLPVATSSAHAIADPAFARAIADFCARERVDVAHALEELETASPFRRQD
jgi:predicted N-acyltransferase